MAPDKATALCGVARNAAALLLALSRCDRRAADAAFSGVPFDEEGCEDAAETSYDAAHAKLSGCPSCLNAVGLRMMIRSLDDAGNGSVYCASPGGAFLDGLD